MKPQADPFWQGLGTGIALVSVLASALYWKAGGLATFVSGETDQARHRRRCEEAEKVASLSPDFLDACRTAGL